MSERGFRPEFDRYLEASEALGVAMSEALAYSRQPRRFAPSDAETWPPQAFMDGDRVLVWEETGVTPGRWREAWFLDADPEGDHDPGGPRFIDNELSVLADGPTWWLPMPPAPGEAIQ